jgi:RNA polymerase sigma-70 factor, ECF subfamily
MHTPVVEPVPDFEPAIMALLPDLYAAALRMTRNAADAEDLVADAVARAWERRASVRDTAGFRGWVFRILTNAFISNLRGSAARPATESMDRLESDESFSLFERLHQPILLWWGNTEQDFLNRLLRNDLERAIDALPDEFRVVVLLVDVEGFPYQETADALGVPIGTVRSRLARGRAQLQKALWLHALDAGYSPAVKQVES